MQSSIQNKILIQVRDHCKEFTGSMMKFYIEQILFQVRDHHKLRERHKMSEAIMYG